MTHPKRSTDEPLNVSVEKTENRSGGHHLSVITVTDPNTMAKDGKYLKILCASPFFSLQNYKNALLKFSVHDDVLGDLKRANAPSNQLRGTDTNQDASRGHNHRNDHQKKSSVSPTSLSSAISSLSSPSANSSTSSSSSTSSIDNSSSHRSSKNHKKGKSKISDNNDFCKTPHKINLWHVNNN